MTPRYRWDGRAYQYQPRTHRPDPTDAVIHAIGEAALCWEHPEHAGRYRPQHALAITYELLTQLGHRR